MWQYRYDHYGLATLEWYADIVQLFYTVFLHSNYGEFIDYQLFCWEDDYTFLISGERLVGIVAQVAEDEGWVA